MKRNKRLLRGEDDITKDGSDEDKDKNKTGRKTMVRMMVTNEKETVRTRIKINMRMMN